MSEKHAITYRGFSILVTSGLGGKWFARWEELTGEKRGGTYGHITKQDAVDVAVQAVDTYHRQIDRAKYP